jgi:hypothetical protein
MYILRKCGIESARLLKEVNAFIVLKSLRRIFNPYSTYNSSIEIMEEFKYLGTTLTNKILFRKKLRAD